MRHHVLLFASAALLAVATSARADIIAGDNPGGPVTVTEYKANAKNGFVVNEDVSYSAAAGSWHKEFTNTGAGGVASGFDVSLDETFNNVGELAWTDWHETVLSTTTVNDDSNYPGFLFTAGSVSVYRNGGLLTPGAQYTLVPDVFMQPGSPENNGNWIGLTLLFGPGNQILPGDTLRVTKQIFEVFLDANVWMPDESAVVGQYPTVPEPSTFVLAALASMGWLALRYRRRANR
jgi:PEP-CTERM motif